MIKFCQNCYETKWNKYNTTGYYYGFKDEILICPHCNKEMLIIDFPALDLRTLMCISDSKEFIDAMIELYNKDKIEYQLKMSQFKVQEAQILESKKQPQQQNTPKCPTCGSTNIKKISAGSRWLSTGMFGISSSKIGKSMECRNCGYKW